MEFFHIPGSSVKGASAKRAQEVSGQIGSDIGKQVDGIKKQALNIKVSDVFDGISRLQKVPKDFSSIGEYVKEQFSGMVKSSK